MCPGCAPGARPRKVVDRDREPSTSGSSRLDETKGRKTFVDKTQVFEHSWLPDAPRCTPAKHSSQLCQTRYLPLAGIFDMIGVEIQDFQELKPKPETSEQDLDDGRG